MIWVDKNSTPLEKGLQLNHHHPLGPGNRVSIYTQWDDQVGLGLYLDLCGTHLLSMQAELISNCSLGGSGDVNIIIPTLGDQYPV